MLLGQDTAERTKLAPSAAGPPSAVLQMCEICDFLCRFQEPKASPLGMQHTQQTYATSITTAVYVFAACEHDHQAWAGHLVVCIKHRGIYYSTTAAQ